MKKPARENFSEAAREFYSGKYAEHGDSIEAVGWRSAEKQELRFEVLAGIGEIDGARVLDVGCGFGDMLDYFIRSGKDVQYFGMDIMEDFVNTAQVRLPGARLFAFDILDDAPEGFEPPFDYVLASGLLGLNLGDNGAFAREALRKMYEWCGTGVAANFVSSYVDYREDYLAYTSPEEIFKFCKTELTGRVALRHDYLPHEFSLYLYR